MPVHLRPVLSPMPDTLTSLSPLDPLGADTDHANV